MIKQKPVSVPNAAFIFCRYTLAVIVWLGFILKAKELILVSFLLLALSALLKIKKAPLVFFYTNTINKIIKSKDIILNEYSMRFAHIMGTIIGFICVILLYSINEGVGWWIVLLFAILKTVSAVGFCPAAKMYECMGNGKCCAFLKKKKKEDKGKKL